MSVLLMTQAFVNVDAARGTRSAANSRPTRPASERLEARRDARINAPVRRTARDLRNSDAAPTVVPVVSRHIVIKPVVTSEESSRDASDASSEAPSSPRGSSSGLDADARSSVTIDSVSSDDSDVDMAPKMSAAEKLLGMLGEAPIATRNAITAKEALWRDGVLGHDEALKAASRWKNSRYKELFIQMIMDNMNLEEISAKDKSYVDSALSRGDFQILNSANLGSTGDDDRGGEDFGGYDNTPVSPVGSETSGSSASHSAVVINVAPKPFVAPVQPPTTEELLIALRTDVADLREALALKDARDVEAQEEKALAKQRKAEAQTAAQRRSRLVKGTLAVVAVAGAAYAVWHFGGIWEVIGKVSSILTPPIIVVEKMAETVKEVVMPDCTAMVHETLKHNCTTWTGFVGPSLDTSKLGLCADTVVKAMDKTCNTGFGIARDISRWAHWLTGK